MLMAEVPSPAQTASFLSSSGFNASAGYWGGGGAAYTPGSGWAGEVGFVSPQIGASYHYSVEVHDAGSPWW
jgi:hypothetical protein